MGEAIEAELEAMSVIADAMEGLTDDEKMRVRSYFLTKYPYMYIADRVVTPKQEDEK